MTPLKAIEAIQAVKFVPSTRYPLNKVCAHPECDREDVTAHHIFGRGKGEHSDSWFVLLPLNGGDGAYGKKPIPGVVGLCGDGTTGHHGDCESHAAWIKYEDGVFVWYDYAPRDAAEGTPFAGGVYLDEAWERLGPLDPQPFNWGDRKKKPKKRKQGDEKRKTRTKTFRFPDDVEDGRGQVEDNLAAFEAMFREGEKPRSEGWILMSALDYAVLCMRDELALEGGGE